MGKGNKVRKKEVKKPKQDKKMKAGRSRPSQACVTEPFLL